ncbi:MAG: protein-L-isoaspartate O-methyltransferase [Candidatus Methanoliparum thermophilum]|uniref:Protein-L-isoaspartate O-methyltransferase n=1 Tax=Methanoliparum thermophilum TaxID=2491083 RepID=A0A520KR00_METT2|nr:protein-L-isoaspartate O-methyltransferase [Candidatus Methanoliparum sp. LAM-1]RZN64048.1 MAG: protein-L-isoaspartate O-methyltransferase [Candidatus Methanoliparum thermophilum]BDC35697.1 protein-L-isoaspartate O-methyltransferase [Candidatus Methanoliparum sp. LAM-1]
MRILGSEEKRKELIDELKAKGYIISKKVEEAMLSVPRELFIPDNKIMYAYEDQPLEIGLGQTISAPHMVAMMTEILNLQEGNKVLEIGTGSGYQAAIISKIVGKDGKIVSIERFADLARFAKENLKKAGITGVKIVISDGSLGYKDEAPYDKICVTCATPDIPPPLIEQLKPGGRMVIPVGSRYFQELFVVDKDEYGHITKKNTGGVVFVPLIGKYGFKYGI